MNDTLQRGGLTLAMMRRFGRLAIILVAAILIPAIAAAEPELAGVYASRGINPDGSEYHGAVHILRHGNRFIVTWMSPRAAGEALLLELTSVGVGILSGGTLAVSYVAGATVGIAVYQIGQDGELVGRWTTVGDDEVHAETLTKLPKPVPDEPAAADPPDDSAPAPPKHRAPRPSVGTVSL